MSTRFECKPLSGVDMLNFMDDKTSIDVVFGYFRKNGFLQFNVRIDDFVNITSKYIIGQTTSTISIGKNNKHIDAFNQRVCNMDIISKQLFIAVDDENDRMFRIYIFYIHSIAHWKYSKMI